MLKICSVVLLPASIYRKKEKKKKRKKKEKKNVLPFAIYFFVVWKKVL